MKKAIFLSAVILVAVLFLTIQGHAQSAARGYLNSTDPSWTKFPTSQDWQNWWDAIKAWFK